ncbi:hypothetical protein Tco_0790886 [Tanacetum coccineum]
MLVHTRLSYRLPPSNVWFKVEVSNRRLKRYSERTLGKNRALHGTDKLDDLYSTKDKDEEASDSKSRIESSMLVIKSYSSTPEDGGDIDTQHSIFVDSAGQLNSSFDGEDRRLEC